MALSQEEINKIHEEEAERAKARAQYTPQNPQTVVTKKKTSCVTWGCLGSIILIAFLMFIAACSAIITPKKSPTTTNDKVTTNTETAQTETQESSDTSNDFVGIGENGILDNGSEDVLLGVSKEDNDQIVHNYVINDLDAVAQMVLDGKAFFVPTQTKVLVIERDFGVRQVRILEGDFSGQSGWIPYEFVKPIE